MIFTASDIYDNVIQNQNIPSLTDEKELDNYNEHNNYDEIFNSSNYLNPNTFGKDNSKYFKFSKSHHSDSEEINYSKLLYTTKYKSSPKDTIQTKINLKKDKTKQKKIFIIKKDDNNIKKKEIITGNGKRKIMNSTKRISNRKPNIRDMIITNFIQNIIRNWINYKEKNKKKILQKINPSIFKKNNYLDLIKNKTIEEIFKLEISKRIENKNINKEIINSSDKEKSIKFKFTLKQIFLAFNQISSREEKLIEKIPELEDMKTEDKNYVKNIFTGLKEKEEYFKEKKKGSKNHQEKFQKVFNDLASYLNENS